MKIENDEDRAILIYAFQYALGRETYVVDFMMKMIKYSWSSLLPGDREFIHRKIRQAITEGIAGSNYEVAKWKEILILPV